MTNHSRAMDSSLELIVMLFGQSKYANIRRFSQFFVTKQEFLDSKKYKKNTVSSTMTTIYI